MSTLLLHVAGNRLYNFSIFRPHLYVYDDRIVYKRRHWISADEISLTYNHISQTNLHKYIVRFAHLEIITTGQQVIKLKWLPKKQTEKIKHIIDEKTYQAHKHNQNSTDKITLEIKDFELALKRLNELKNTGKISEREFDKKKQALLKKYY